MNVVCVICHQNFETIHQRYTQQKFEWFIIAMNIRTSSYSTMIAVHTHASSALFSYQQNKKQEKIVHTRTRAHKMLLTIWVNIHE